MKYCLALSLLAVLFFQSCSEEPWLTGKLDMSESEAWKPMVYLVQPQRFNEVAQSFVGLVLDSAEVDIDGQFQFKDSPRLEGKGILEIVVQKKGEKYPNRLLNDNPETDNYFPLIYEPDVKIEIQADIANFQSSFFIKKPSIANKAMLELRDARLVAFNTYQKESTLEHQEDENLLEREKKVHAYQEKLIQFGDSTSELLAALMALRWASPEGDYERIAELVHEQSIRWSELYPEHLWVKELVAMADKRNLPILIGDVIPELQFPMKNEDEVSLQAILKNKKLIVLDVWASWCAPCRLENRNVLVPLWEKYNSANFQIVAYGLESSEKAWNNAIQKDGAYRWLHASHLQGDQNPFMETLRLKTIPANLLLDEEGRVLAKNLHGQDLIDFVDDYMSK